MAFKDYVAQGVSVGKDAVFDLKEVYTAVFRWLNRYKYGYQELGYKETVEETGKEITTEIYSEKEINDYYKFVIEIKVSIKNMINVEVKNRNKQKGNIEFIFDAYVLKDYESDWGDNAFLRFFRESYDRFIGKSRVNQYETELKDELDKFVRELKSFLDLHSGVN